MSLTAAIGRIQQIESRFSDLTGQVAQNTTPAGPAATQPAGQGADAFAAALAQIVAPATTAPSAPAATGGIPQLAATARGASPTSNQAAAPAPLVDDGVTTGADVVATAKKYLGTPYVWGGESLAEGGLDCSGLVQLTLSEHGVDVPRVARDQMHAGQEVPSLDQAAPGDLIVTRGGAHIGIYVGDNEMIHAPRPGKTVEIRSLLPGEITTIRRIVPAA